MLIRGFLGGKRIAERLAKALEEHLKRIAN